MHRDLYLSDELFALEQRHFFANTWNYIGHASQVPAAGDYLAVEIAGRPLLMVRQPDGAVRVLYNRCAHKGTPLVSDGAGNTGRFFRCPYHAWTYRLDGAPLAVPLESGYEGTRMSECESGRGMEAPARSPCTATSSSPSSTASGPTSRATSATCWARSTTWSTARRWAACDRRRLPAQRDPLQLEDLPGEHQRHGASAVDARVGDRRGEPRLAGPAGRCAEADGDGADPAVRRRLRLLRPHGRAGLPNGHSVLGTHFSIHSGYAQLPDYEAAMREAYGEARAAEILQRSPQNALCFPSLSVKGSPQAIRVIRPLAADRTLVEAWSFRVEGAPDLLFERSMTYNRLVFSPMSVVAHDDMHLFESIQKGLRGEGNEWVSLHRGFAAASWQRRRATSTAPTSC